MRYYTISAEPYYDSSIEQYIKILTISGEPDGPLKDITRKMNRSKLSPFQEENRNTYCSNSCIYALLDLNNKNNFMCVDNTPILFTFLLNNNYTIDYNMTKLMNKSDVKMNNSLLCYISY